VLERLFYPMLARQRATVRWNFSANVMDGALYAFALSFVSLSTVVPVLVKKMWGSIAQQIGLKDVRLDTVDLEMAGDTAYEVGEAVLTLAKGTAAVKFVVVWKQVDGQWRLHRDIWNGKGN
jgi:ketosteroid isomerase-like protein